MSAADSSVCAFVSQGNSVDALTLHRRPPVDVATLLRDAIGVRKLEGVGRSIGFTPSYWTRVLSCERGLTLDRLGRLDLDVQRDLVKRWGEALGMRIERRGSSESRELAELITTKRVRIILEAI